MGSLVRRGRRARRLVARALLLVVVSSSLLVVGAPAAKGAPEEGWRPPVPGRLVEPFRAPAARYAAGHRGVDFAAPPGTVVRAAGSGTVVVAGPVAGSLHVVVAHDGGLRTSYSFLATVSARVGAHVGVGTALGTAGGSGPAHEPGVLHFGLRIGDEYVDPMVLFRPVDLTKLVRLAPVDEPAQHGLDPPELEARSLSDALGLDRPGPGSVASSFLAGAAPDGSDSAGGSDGRGPDLLGAAGDVVGGAAGWLALAVVGGAGATSAVAGWVWRRTPFAAVARDLGEAGRRFADWVRSRFDCTDGDGGGPGGGGSGHRLMAVAGINSHTDPRTGATFALDTDALGYRRSEVDYFSYSGRATYTAADTQRDLDRAASLLADQLRAAQRREPGREVDLIGHSQGGVVIDLFLSRYYDASDETFPPLGTVVTLSSPHTGAPIATAIGEARETATGRAIVGAVDEAAGGAVPRSESPAVGQLREGSRVTRSASAPLPDHVELTAIGSVDDLVVPANHAGHEGARNVTLNADGFNDHSAILRDAAALRAARLALEGRQAPCIGFTDGLRGAIEPVVISRLEHTAGDAARAAGRSADLVSGAGR
jgi:hypothetical protein